MKALVYAGKESLQIEERPIPKISDGEALIKVHSAGICGTDLSILKGLHPRAKAPLVMGHELSGEIVDIKPSSGFSFHKGDFVTVEPLKSCGECGACKKGFSYVCANLRLYGIDFDGAFAEYLKVPVSTLYKLPDGVDLETGALIEPIAVAVHAVRISSLKYADTVCVLGGGPIGTLTALVASHAGAGKVLVCEMEPFRLELARSFGLEVVDVNKHEPVEKTMEITGGRGADIVFEAAGAPPTVLAATRMCSVRGEVVVVAMPKTLIPFDIVSLTFREITVKGVRVYAPYDFERAIQLVMNSGIDFGKLISARFTLDEGEEAFAKAKEGKDVMRILFRINT